MDEFFNSETTLPSGLVVVSDVGSGHDFPWLLLLFRALATQSSPVSVRRRVVVFSANHAREHYELVLRRHGLDVAKLEVDGQLKLVFPNPRGPPQVEEVLCEEPTAVFLDDLEALECFGGAEPREMRKFIAILFAKLRDTALTTIVAFGRSTPATPWMGDSPPLTEFCKYRATVLVSVEPLSSGRSSDAHGLVCLTRREQLHAPPSVVRFTFKAAGNDSVTFAKIG